MNEPADLAAPITNVNQSLWRYIWQRKKWMIVVTIPLVIAWEILVLAMFVPDSSGSSRDAQGIFFLMVLPFGVIASIVGRMRKQFEAAFLQQFAEANGYTFDQTGTVDETYGSIFRIGYDQEVSDIVTGTYGGHDFRLFLFKTVVGSGKNRQEYRDTVIELDLEGKLPHVLLSNKQGLGVLTGSLNPSQGFGTLNTVSLEGDFNKYFNLYVPPGQEVAALAVFSPDIMQLMEDRSKHLSVELAGNRVYIYLGGFVTTADQLERTYELAKQLNVKLGRMANEMKFDPDVAPTPTNAAISGSQSLFPGMTWRKLGLVAAVSFGLMVVMFFVLFYVFSLPSVQQWQRQQSQPDIQSSP